MGEESTRTDVAPPLWISSSSPSSDLAVSASPVPAAGVVETLRTRRFRVELTPGATTIVSWKKNFKDDRKGNAARFASIGAPPTGAHPALDSIVSPTTALDRPVEGGMKDGQPPAKRFNAVIEKIERLYMGSDSGDEEEFGDVPDDDQYDTDDSFIDDAELNDYFQVDKSATKYDGFFINRGKLEKRERCSPPNMSPKKRRKEATNLPSENGNTHMPTEHANVGTFRMKASARNAPVDKKRPSSSLVDYGKPHQEAKLLKNSSCAITVFVEKKNSSVNTNLFSPSKPQNQNIAMPTAVKDGFTQSRDFANKSRGHGKPMHSNNEREHNKQGKEGSVVRPKVTTLERAIWDLEKVVAESKKSKLFDAREADASQVVKKRLPTEVKHQLAKVVRLADIQGKITSAIFFDRLMEIFGDLMQPKSLKRHLKEMVALGMLVKQKNANKFQKIKKEVIEMIQTWMASSKFQASKKLTSPSNDLHMTHGEKALKPTFSIDDAIGEKICDLYDLHVEGLDEELGTQARKLYLELAELWPAGYMDKHGIKDAIAKSKERRRAVYKQRRKIKEDERFRRKMSEAAYSVNEKVRQINRTMGFTKPIITCPNKRDGHNIESKNEARSRANRKKKLSFDYDPKSEISSNTIQRITHVIALPCLGHSRISRQ